MKFCYLLFVTFSLHFSSQTFSEIEKKIKDAPHLISEGKKDEFIHVMNEVILSSVKVGYPYGVASGYYGKAYIAHVNRDYSNSINFAKLSESENLKTEYSKLKTDNYHLLAQEYAELELNEEAIRYYRKMIISSKAIPDKIKSIYNENIAYNDLASIYHFNKNEDSAYYYTQKIYNNLHDHHDLDEKLNILLAKATAALSLINKSKGEKDSADYYMNKSITQLPKKFTNNSKTSNLFGHLASVYGSQAEFAKAKKYVDLYTENSEKNKILYDIKIAYKLNSEISDETGSSRQAYKYLKKYVEVSDSINKIDKNNINKIFDKDIQEKKKRIKEEITYSRYLLIIIILIVLTLSCGAYFIKGYLKKKDNKKKNIIVEKEVEIKNLESKVNAAFEEIISLAKSNSPNFLIRFREVHPSFCDKIIEIYPEIQNSELIFCAYIRLNFTTKEIANSIFVTPKTVQMRKYRLRKKLNIPSDIDIYMWMNSF
ncbi:tetratricopeptide repeat protein [Chryseobacterium sp. SIMBA_029]|uniref:tetratricopeptide repeat protein n=1 Tax=Chryseobacterium sp. SIMBA_029 TaxID=3085772 RepID=UPI00397DF6A5